MGNNASEWLPNIVDDQHVVIPTGLSLSTALNTHGQTVVGLVIPDTLTGAKLKILAARKADPDNYNIVCNSLGVDFEMVKNTDSGVRYYNISPADLLPIQKIKLQSDTTQSGGDCTIYVISRAL